ncbi:MAG: hypothetical protein DMG67_04955, partial [Acidobacteria bacterium]
MRANIVVAGAVNPPLVGIGRRATERDVDAGEEPFVLIVETGIDRRPGSSVVNCTKLRPFSGNSRTCWPSTVLATAPVWVSTSTGEASTSTFSVLTPICNCTLSAVVSATCSARSRSVTCLKPV